MRQATEVLDDIKKLLEEYYKTQNQEKPPVQHTHLETHTDRGNTYTTVVADQPTPNA